MVPNAPKRKETHQNMRLGSNGMDRERSLWKILTRHRGTNFCINCTSVARFLAIAKRSQMHPNGKKHTKTWVYGLMLWIMSVSCEELWHDFVARTFTLIAPVWRILHQVSCSSETVTNAPKRKQTYQNRSLWSNGVDRERRCEKFLQDFVARTFALIAPVWHILRQVSCSSKTVPNAPKRKETHQNMSF